MSIDIVARPASKPPPLRHLPVVAACKWLGASDQFGMQLCCDTKTAQGGRGKRVPPLGTMPLLWSAPLSSVDTATCPWLPDGIGRWRACDRATAGPLREVITRPAAKSTRQGDNCSRVVGVTKTIGRLTGANCLSLPRYGLDHMRTCGPVDAVHNLRRRSTRAPPAPAL